MADLLDTSLVADLARDTVRQVAPQELPLFRAYCEAYFKDPEKPLKGKQGKDEMLGFGTGAEVALLTPVVLAIAKEVVQFVAGEIAKSAKNESSGLIHDAVKKMFGKFRTADGEDTQAPPPLTRNQLARVRQKAYEIACRMNVPTSQADLLADSVVGSLVVAQ